MFKTDHLEYFETVTEILQQLKTYTIVEHTSDLHGSEYNEHNILTEFEMLFKSKGNPPIGFLRAGVLWNMLPPRLIYPVAVMIVNSK